MIRKGCPEEYPITLYINNQELAVFQLTNKDLEDWGYGYLYSEGFIKTPDDIESLEVLYDQMEIRVVLKADADASHWSQKKKHYTAGCGKGVTFFSMTDIKQFNRIENPMVVSQDFLLEKIREFSSMCEMYLETGGMHGACLIHPNGNLTVREDIGRHNAVDKAIGYAIRNQLNPSELIVLTTGRISYEMLSKVAKFGVSIVGSRTAATKQAVQLAKVLNVEVVGYIRGKMMNLYTESNRVVESTDELV